MTAQATDIARPLMIMNHPERELEPMLQFLSPDGTLTEVGRQANVDTHVAKRLYRDMVLARALDREAVALQRQGELSLWLQCEGQEAAQVGSVHAMRSSDHVFPSYFDLKKSEACRSR